MTTLPDRWPATSPDHIQLYSLPTPNGQKASIALEELGLPPHPVDAYRRFAAREEGWVKVVLHPGRA